MERYGKLYTNMKININKEEDETYSTLINLFNTYDAKDRSFRYAQKVFDPSFNGKEENDEVFAYGIADYRSEEPTDLTFTRGDKIKVLLQHSSGWWDGEFNGKKGKFPKTFVVIPKHQETNIIMVESFFIIEEKYVPRLSSEMEIDVGDLIFVEFIKCEKCNGINLRTGRKGAFPVSLIKID
jgi:hypothetical protein